MAIPDARNKIKTRKKKGFVNGNKTRHRLPPLTLILNACKLFKINIQHFFGFVPGHNPVIVNMTDRDQNKVVYKPFTKKPDGFTITLKIPTEDLFVIFSYFSHSQGVVPRLAETLRKRLGYISAQTFSPLFGAFKGLKQEIVTLWNWSYIYSMKFISKCSDKCIRGNGQGGLNNMYKIIASQSNDLNDLKTRLRKMVAEQIVIFSNPLIGAELDKAPICNRLNELQKDFEGIVTDMMGTNRDDVLPEPARKTWGDLVNGTGTITFEHEFPPELKNHIPCTLARLMMLKEGLSLVEAVCDGSGEVVFTAKLSKPSPETVKTPRSCEMFTTASGGNNKAISHALDSDSGSDSDTPSDTESTESTDSLISSESSSDTEISGNSENVLVNMRELRFKETLAVKKLINTYSLQLNTYNQRNEVNEDEHEPLECNEGSGSSIYFPLRIDDGDFVAGGEDEGGNLMDVLCPSFILLGHELIHCLHNQWGLNLREIQAGLFKRKGEYENSYQDLEEFETIQGRHFSFSENKLRVAAGFNEKYGIRLGHKWLQQRVSL